MFSWFRNRQAGPPADADYSRIDSRERAEQASRRGDLHKLLLFPPEFGGEDIFENVAYLPPLAAEAKWSIDANLVRSLAERQRVRKYVVRPSYLGRSFVPAAIAIEASGPGSFSSVIHVWGPGSSPRPAADDSPEGRVRSFLRDYRDWNARAAKRFGKAYDEAMELRIDREYDELVARYCPPAAERQGIVYGTDPAFDPGATRIVAVSTGDAQAVIRTAKRMHPESDSYHVHEFDLALQGARWLLTGIYYIDGDERLPVL